MFFSLSCYHLFEFLLILIIIKMKRMVLKLEISGRGTVMCAALGLIFDIARTKIHKVLQHSISYSSWLLKFFFSRGGWRGSHSGMGTKPGSWRTLYLWGSRVQSWGCLSPPELGLAALVRLFLCILKVERLHTHPWGTFGPHHAMYRGILLTL